VIAPVQRQGRDAVPLPIREISRGGGSLESSRSIDPDTEVWLTLPGTDARVSARAVRTDGKLMALAFRQDETMLKTIDRALDHIAGTVRAAAA